MRGRKPKPMQLRILEGNPGHRPLPAPAPTLPAAVPPCLEWLDAAAQDYYRAIAPDLAAAGILTGLDGHALACLCQALSDYQWATATLAKEGRLVEVGTQKQPHPALSIQRHAWKAVREGCALFGLDPSSRGRLKVTPPEKAEGVSGFARKRAL